ncbi:MAG: GTPase Era [Firmicutes bacterium HGW-Firmicutes-9]|jgi:GTP-binding protein Era|nr:MAG: GTPase Era [Firmicutes bacterium HGW-Firmicutes-9]
MSFRSGFISIIGCPNVGKSTLLNKMIGQKIAIVSDRAQTTRNKITGVLSKPDYQMIFLDTPGVTMPKNKLGEYMQKVAYDAINEVEAILFVADAEQGVRERDAMILEKLSKAKAPVIAFINKTDAASLGQANEAQEVLEQQGFIKQILRGSASNGKGLEELERALADYMVPGPQYFPDDMVTDQPERIIVGELIREKALLMLREEVPHGVGVGVDKMERREDRDIMDVYATIYCERESHKGIIIGKGGSMLKRIGQESRKDIEWMLGCQVNLQLWIKIKEDWRNRPGMLHELGYE